MKENLKSLIYKSLSEIDPDGDHSNLLFNIEQSRQKSHGDYACNIAMVLAKTLKKKPREIAKLLTQHLPDNTLIDKTEIAGPGFINFFLAKTAYGDLVLDILSQKQNYGHSDLGKNHKVLIEFVSANPTGPLHVGHGRGAAFGASLANILEKAGYQVHREYYVNDAGRQMHILTLSIWLRYLEACGTKLNFPADAYKGEYVIQIAQDLKEKFKTEFVKPYDFKSDQEIDHLIQHMKTVLGKEGYQVFFQAGLTTILADIKDDLAGFGVTMDSWFSEQHLENEGLIQHGIDALTQKGHTFEQDGALWFRSTEFGDDKDRVLVRENGQPTYFASDVAYHLNKFERGYDLIIDVLGADHHGYVPRLRASIQALGYDDTQFIVPIVQFATLVIRGEKVQMSTRSGQFVTLRSLWEDIGAEAARFFYVQRKVEQHMDFDVDLAKSKSNENPVYYIQYAHARICSVWRQLSAQQAKREAPTDNRFVEHLNTDHEQRLLNLLMQFPESIELSAKHFEPHTLVHYLQDLADAFHSYYNAHQFLVDNAEMRMARLHLVKAVQQVIYNGLTLLGVRAPEEM